MSESISPASARADARTALVLPVIGLMLVAAVAPFAFLVCGSALLRLLAVGGGDVTIVETAPR